MGRYNGPIWKGLEFKADAWADNDEDRMVVESVSGKDVSYRLTLRRSGRAIARHTNEISIAELFHLASLTPPSNGDWSGYVPDTDLPNTGPKDPKVGEVWAFALANFHMVGQVLSCRPPCVGVKILAIRSSTYSPFLVGNTLNLGTDETFKWAERLFEVGVVPLSTSVQAKPERQLAPGWKRCEDFRWFVCTEKNGSNRKSHRSRAADAVFVKVDAPGAPGACEDCAEELGVYADEPREEPAAKTRHAVPEGEMPPNRSEWRAMADFLDRLSPSQRGEFLGPPLEDASPMDPGEWYFIPSGEWASLQVGGVIRVKSVKPESYTDRILRVKVKVLAYPNKHILATDHVWAFDARSQWGEAGWRPIIKFPERGLYATTEPKTPEAWGDLGAFLAKEVGSPPWLGDPVKDGKFEEDQLYFFAPKQGDLPEYLDEHLNEMPLIIRVRSTSDARVFIEPLSGVLEEHNMPYLLKERRFGKLAWRPLLRLPRPEMYATREPVISTIVAGTGIKLPDINLDFRVGDVVELVSGGPDMVVTHVGADIIGVSWFNGEKLERAFFRPPCLRKIG